MTGDSDRISTALQVSWPSELAPERLTRLAKGLKPFSVDEILAGRGDDLAPLRFIAFLEDADGGNAGLYWMDPADAPTICYFTGRQFFAYLFPIEASFAEFLKRASSLITSTGRSFVKGTSDQHQVHLASKFPHLVSLEGEDPLDAFFKPPHVMRYSKSSYEDFLSVHRSLLARAEAASQLGRRIARIFVTPDRLRDAGAWLDVVEAVFAAKGPRCQRHAATALETAITLSYHDASRKTTRAGTFLIQKNLLRDLEGRFDRELTPWLRALIRRGAQAMDGLLKAERRQ